MITSREVQNLIKLLTDNGYSISAHGVICKPDEVTGLPISLGKVDLEHLQQKNFPTLREDLKEYFPIPFCSPK